MLNFWESIFIGDQEYGNRLKGEISSPTFEDRLALEVDLEMENWVLAILDYLNSVEEWSNLNTSELDDIFNEILTDRAFQEELVIKTTQGLKQEGGLQELHPSYFDSVDSKKPPIMLVKEAIPVFIKRLISRSSNMLDVTAFLPESHEPIMNIIQTNFDKWFGEKKRKNVLKHWETMKNKSH